MEKFTEYKVFIPSDLEGDFEEYLNALPETDWEFIDWSEA